jgi:hypothetical protein
MFLIQLLIPLYDNDGRPYDRAEFDRLRSELAGRFGGVTAHTRVPAEGIWKEGGEETSHDEVVIFEVMADSLDRHWWRTYRLDLEVRFRQKEIVVRATGFEKL